MQRHRSFAGALCGLSLLLTAATQPGVCQDFDNVEIEVQHVAGNIHMLRGAGGNIGVCAGQEGVFLVDDQYAPLTDKIKTAVASISEGSIRFVLNTHWHGDHTGGNENLGGSGSLILAHDNVRQRLSTKQFHKVFGREYEPSPEGALPVVTFSDEVTFHLNAEEIHAFHVEAAHTDGDAVIHFRRANVVHAGDTFFNGVYPFIDVETGGSIRGTIRAVERILELCDDETTIIPGHGALSNREELERYHTMLVEVRERVSRAIAQGIDLEQAQASGLLVDLDAVWGQGWIKPETMLEIVYSDLSRD